MKNAIKTFVFMSREAKVNSETGKMIVLFCFCKIEQYLSLRRYNLKPNFLNFSEYEKSFPSLSNIIK